MKPRLLVDIDGVLANQAQAMVEWVSKDFGIDSSREHVTSWDHSFSLPYLKFTELVDHYYPLPGFVESMKVQFGAE